MIMNKDKSPSAAQACEAPVASKTSSIEVFSPPPYQPIKLALNVHAARLVVVRMVDAAKVQAPRSFKSAEFGEWARKQKALVKHVISCYEAKPTGE
jgi:hypothetical protein